MKACVIQPPYSRDLTLSEEYFNYKLNKLRQCDETMDIIVLPEYSDVPCATTNLEETLYYHKKYIDVLLDNCRETAIRCNSLVFVNALCPIGDNYRNTTYAFDRKGQLVGKYYKKHLPPLELETLSLDSAYTFEPSEPYVIEIEGLRYGFLTCYDFYFYEAFANIARNNVDIIIGCSLQRSDSHDAIETMCRFLAYNTNAYVIRSSVSFDESSTICGASMIVHPTGRVLANMGGKFGMATADFDPKDKYYKPAGYGNPDASHYEYIEYGRKPWQYRPGGSAIVNDDRWMPYPRICAHRGFSNVAPENSLPAFGAAVALGAQEIEFDLWTTKDGKWVSIHDNSLERVSDGRGNVWDYTLEELRKLDFGFRYSEDFRGLRILTLEEILQKFACHTVMNIHIKTKAEMGEPDEIYDDKLLWDMINLIRRYDCANYVYFMTVSTRLHKKLSLLCPDIARCMGENSDNPTTIVDRAIECGCSKVQLFHTKLHDGLIERAHSHGILCNLFYCDEPENVRKYLDMGIDCILTNNYLAIKNEFEGSDK